MEGEIQKMEMGMVYYYWVIDTIFLLISFWVHWKRVKRSKDHPTYYESIALLFNISWLAGQPSSELKYISTYAGGLVVIMCIYSFALSIVRGDGREK